MKGIERESIHRGPEGGRNIERYEQELDRDFNNLQGKRVLEIGSGSELRFANGLKAKGIEVEVISLSPAFADVAERERALAHGAGTILAGEAEHLPLPDTSVDAVISLHVAEHLTEEKFLALIRETVRVMRVGASADIAPVYDMEFYPNHIIPDLQEQLGNAAKVTWRRPRSPFDSQRLPDDTGYKQETDVYILTIEKLIQ